MWLKSIMILLLFIGINNRVFSQVQSHADSIKADSLRKDAGKTLKNQYDIGDLISNVFHPHRQPDSVIKRSGITIIPNIASNPSIGSQLGIKAVAEKKLGNDPNTLLSVAATSASITTKGIIYFYVNHNIFTPGNKYNFQGNLVIAKTVTPDYGLGIANASNGSEADQVLANIERKGRALHSVFFNVREKVYKEVQKNLFVGAGVSFDVRRDIEDNVSKTDLTPYNIYSDRHGFDRSGYSANGLLFNVQYTTRDNQNRAYNGIYADAGFRVNQTWLGSSKSAAQFITDFRKYFSLSHQNPEHVIAFWNWGSYLLSGNIPYLELPGTAKDGSFRSGRGYTTGYFKGTQYNYSEAEYRFPITKNKFLSGVAFLMYKPRMMNRVQNYFKSGNPALGRGYVYCLTKLRAPICALIMPTENMVQRASFWA